MIPAFYGRPGFVTQGKAVATIRPMLKRMDAVRARRLVADASSSPLTNPFVEYPHWYLQRWHFLPEGYLSRRSAAGYDLVVRNLYSALQEQRITRALLAMMRAEAPRHVLELGCGPGRLLRAVSKSRIAQRVTGVDLSPFMLERSQRRNRSGVELVHSSGLDLPWDEPEFDAIVAAHYFGHLPPETRQPAVAEAARILKPGGTLYVVDHAWHEATTAPGLLPLGEERRVLGAIRLTAFQRPANPARDDAEAHAVMAQEGERALA